jgi:hypothetical protein
MSVSMLEKKLYPKEGSREYLVLRMFHSSLIGTWCSALTSPQDTQKKRLVHILRNLKGTSVARDHHLHPSMSFEEFRQNVPISTYESYQSKYLASVHQGNKKIISASPITACMESSGTTGQPKWIPINALWEQSVLQAQKLWITSMIKDFPHAARGRSFSIVSKAFHSMTSGGLPIGSNTGRMLHRQPWYIKKNPIFPLEVQNIVGQDVLQYTMLRFALQNSISVWTTANPSTILLYCRRLEEWKEELSRDLWEGTLRYGPASELSSVQRGILEQETFCVPPPQKWKPAYIWPLAVVNCWKGGPAQYFASQLHRALGAEIPIREVGVSASEGHFSVPMSQDDQGGTLWTMGHVLEFIDEHDRPHWAWEVETGKKYRLVITTESGLIRYDLRDIVEITGFTDATPQIRFVGKSGNFLNAVGEKVSEEQISQVLKKIAEPNVVGCTVRIYWSEVPHYILAVEGDVNETIFSQKFDHLLQEFNLEYESKRKSDRLGFPTFQKLSDGFYSQYRQQCVERGASDAQVKDIIVCSEEKWKEIQY